LETILFLSEVSASLGAYHRSALDVSYLSKGDRMASELRAMSNASMKPSTFYAIVVLVLFLFCNGCSYVTTMGYGPVNARVDGAIDSTMFTFRLYAGGAKQLDVDFSEGEKEQASEILVSHPQFRDYCVLLSEVVRIGPLSMSEMEIVFVKCFDRYMRKEEKEAFVRQFRSKLEEGRY
jgi:hypothetical protein